MKFARKAIKNVIALTVASCVVALVSENEGVQMPESLASKISDVLHSERNHIDIQKLVSESSPDKESHARGLSLVRHTVERGETLSGIWQEYGDSADSSVEYSKALKEVKPNAERLRVGETLALFVSKDGDIRGVRKRLDDGRLIVLRGGGEDEEITSRVVEPKVLEEDKVVSGTIECSFSKAARKAGLSYAVIDDLVDLFGGRIDFRRDLQPGDTFTVMYQERSTGRGASLEHGPIRAASITVDGVMMAVIRHIDSQGREVFYNEKGELGGEYFLRYPVQFTRVSSVFATNRFHPILGINRPHNGVDFAAPLGTPVRNIGDGIVLESGFKSSTGNYVRIKHDDRFTTEYFHLSKIAPGVRSGKLVARGEVIGNVGKTGLATAPHLHFGFFDKGKYVDPLTVKLPTAPNGKDKIPQQYLVATLQALRDQHEATRLAAAQSPKQNPRA